MRKLKWPGAFPGAPWLDQREEKAVLGVLRRRALFRYYGMRRPRCAGALEAAARKYYGADHALAVNSGTGALCTAVTALGIGPGDEVIVPAFLWVSTVAAVVQANAIPVLAEVNDSLCLDPGDLERKITPRTRLIIPVHMAGAPCEMDAIMDVAGRHAVPVLEDSAQCNGGSFRGRKVGTFGLIGMFSLQYNKNATAGEGGLLITQDAALYERMVAAHDVGIPWVGSGPRETSPQSVTWGAGRRMNELTAAVACVQLRKLDRIVRAMRASKRRIKSALEGVPGLAFRRLNDPPGDTGASLILFLKDAAAARKLTDGLRAGGLSATRLPGYGMHVYYNIPQLVRRAPLSGAGNPWSLPQNAGLAREYAKGACPASDALFERAVLVPVPSRLARRQETAAAELIRAVAGS
jgi:8-amino-3,8-dideoxy-alpha-D-manno-octulosonate transaminase